MITIHKTIQKHGSDPCFSRVFPCFSPGFGLRPHPPGGSLRPKAGGRRRAGAGARQRPWGGGTADGAAGGGAAGDADDAWRGTAHQGLIGNGGILPSCNLHTVIIWDNFDGFLMGSSW